MGMSGQSPFSKRLNDIQDKAYDMKKQAQGDSLLVLIIENWREDRIREVVKLTVGKERIEDVTQAEIDNLRKLAVM